MHNSTVMQCHSGKRLDLLNPTPDQITVEDMAWGCSGATRYGCQSPVAITVAEHQILVGMAVVELCKAAAISPRPALVLHLGALVHDAHEAYCGDAIRPLKAAMTKLDGVVDAYCTITKRLDAAIAKFFGIMPNVLHDPLVVKADLQVLKMEAEVWCLWDTSDWSVLQGVESSPAIAAHMRGAQPMDKSHAFLAWQLQLTRVLWCLEKTK